MSRGGRGETHHERRLSGSVTSTETVTVTTLQPQRSGVEENLGSVGEGERAVAEVLTLLLILEDLDLLTLLESTGLEDRPDDTGGGVGAERVGEGKGDVGDEADLPLGKLKVASVDEGGDERGDVVDEGGGDLEGRVGGDLLDGDEDDGGGEGSSRDLGGREIGTISVGLSDFAEGLDGLDDDTTRLGVGDGVLDLDETGEELGEEGSDGVLVVDKLGHVVLRESGVSAVDKRERYSRGGYSQ